MHFSRPSGHRLSWCLPWNLGAVGSFTSGYSTVSTFLNICMKVTAKPLTGLRKSSTGDLRNARRRGLSVRGVQLALQRTFRLNAVVVRQVHRRHGERLTDLLREVSLGVRLLPLPALSRAVDGAPPDQHRV